MRHKSALIAGVTGQDGAYLAHHLLHEGYRVVGSSRDSQTCNTDRLTRLGIKDDIEMISLAPNDFRSVLKAISVISPSEIYNLAGQTSVGLSFEQPVECMDSIAGGSLNFLEVLRFLDADIRFFSAGSSECFGDTGSTSATEVSPFRPRSPYAVAKSTSFWQVANYREAYKLYCCTGILANHDSPLRPSRFVTQKIIKSIKLIKLGKLDSLHLGNIDIWRDWGWAPSYVKAMHLMLQQAKPKDYIIASGRSHSLREFVVLCFQIAELDVEKYLHIDSDLLRPSELRYSSMDPTLIMSDLGWKSDVLLPDIIYRMMNNDH